MTAASTIAKLEALLSRVLARSAEPRAEKGASGAAVGAPAAADRAPAPSGPVEDEVDAPTVPPPARADAREIEVDVAAADGPEIVVGEATASDDALLDEISDSRERLVAADAAPGGEPADETDDVENDEAAPVSSRRPVAPPPEEQLAEIAFGADEPPPTRTPPPKSGPLPAPPAEIDADVTGVRSSVSAPAHDPPRRPPPVEELEPEIARLRQVAEARDPIVEAIGEAQRFAPATFVALLDASLAL